jgi:hypothetical protein
MGLLKKIGKWASDRIGDGPSMSGLKSSIKGTGTLVSTKVAPVVSLVNPALGTGLKVIGEVARGKNLKTAAVEGVKNYGMGKAGHAIAGKVGGSNIPLVGDAFRKSGGAAAMADQLGIGGASAADAGGGHGMVATVAHELLPKTKDGGIDWARAAELGMAVGAGIEGHNAEQRANRLTDEAIQMERDRQNALRPLRDQAIAGLSAPRTPRDEYPVDDANPYRRRLPMVGSRARGGY